MKNDSEIVNSYAKGFLLGSLVGGVVGAVTALLFAPKSGRELRRDIAERSKDMYEKGSEYLEDAQSDLRTAVNQGREKADQIVRTAREQAGDLMYNAEQMLKEARYKAQTARSTVGESLSKVKDAARAGADAFRTEMNSPAPDADTELG